MTILKKVSLAIEGGVNRIMTYNMNLTPVNGK